MQKLIDQVESVNNNTLLCSRGIFGIHYFLR